MGEMEKGAQPAMDGVFRHQNNVLDFDVSEWKPPIYNKNKYTAGDRPQERHLMM